MGKSGHFVGRTDYLPNDFRFTRSKDGKTTYLVAMGWPGTEVLIESFQVNNALKAKVELLGYDGKIKFDINSKKQLQLNLEHIETAYVNSKHAYVFKLSGFDLALLCMLMLILLHLTPFGYILTTLQLKDHNQKKGKANFVILVIGIIILIAFIGWFISKNQASIKCGVNLVQDMTRASSPLC